MTCLARVGGGLLARGNSNRCLRVSYKVTVFKRKTKRALLEATTETVGTETVENQSELMAIK